MQILSLSLSRSRHRCMAGVVALAVTSLLAGWTPIARAQIGKEWQLRVPQPTAEYLAGVASVSGHISVVGGAGTVLHSTDGTSWTTQRVGKRVFQAVASSGTTFLSTSGGSDVWLSTDGLKWTPQKVTLPGLTSLGNVIWDGSRWVGFSDNFDSPQALLASNDGATWTKLMDLPPFDRNIAVRTINAIAYTGSRYVVAGSRSDTDSPYVATTSDGTDWQQVSLGDFSSTSRRIPW